MSVSFRPRAAQTLETGRKSVNYDPSRVAYAPVAQRVGTRAIVHSDPRVADSTPLPYPLLRAADAPLRKMGFWHFRDGLLRVLPMRLMGRHDDGRHVTLQAFVSCCLTWAGS